MIFVIGISVALAILVGFLLSNRDEKRRALGWGLVVAWLISLAGIILYGYVVRS